MSQQYKTLEELRGYIFRKLGACNVRVELGVQQVDDAINDALDMFNNYLCKQEPRVELQRQGSVIIEPLPGDRGIIDVKCLFPQDVREYSQFSIWEIMYRMVFPRLPVGDWYMLKTFYEMYQKVRGTDPDWYEDESTGVLYVDCISGPWDVFYIVSRDLRIEDLPVLKAGYTRDFRKLAVAEAKITLSRVRGKFQGTIPVPGGSLSLDAETLKQEGMVERDQIEAKLDQMARFARSPIIWT